MKLSEANQEVKRVNPSYEFEKNVPGRSIDLLLHGKLVAYIMYDDAFLGDALYVIEGGLAIDFRILELLMGLQKR